MHLKPQDVYVGLLLCLEDSLSYADMASRLGLSTSETHGCVSRLTDAGLVVKKQMKRRLFHKFLVHGVPHAFAIKEGEVSRGIPTAWAAPVLKDHFSSSEKLPPVWPHPEGKIKGASVKPLYASVPSASKKNSRLYDLLSLVDALRIGRAREKKIAEKLLKEKILK